MSGHDKSVPLRLSGRDAQRILALSNRIEIGQLRIAAETSEIRRAERERSDIARANGIPDGMPIRLVTEPGEDGLPEGAVVDATTGRAVMVPDATEETSTEAFVPANGASHPAG